jgi:hypothetical protein
MGFGSACRQVEVLSCEHGVSAYEFNLAAAVPRVTCNTLGDSESLGFSRSTAGKADRAASIDQHTLRVDTKTGRKRK